MQIQYVAKASDARSTRVLQRICGAPGAGVVGITVHRTCQCAGQLNVNQHVVALGATWPVNWTPVHGATVWVAAAISGRRLGRLPMR